VLIAFWSAAGGSGTSVFTAACALVLAREAHDTGGGGVRIADLAGDLPESGATLAVALTQGPAPVLVDCGTAREPASRAVVEVADIAVVVLRECYLGLRRAVHAPALEHTDGVVLLHESTRSLSAREVGDVLDLPILARVPVRDTIARAVDAGVLTTRLPEPLARAATNLVRRVGVRSGRRGEAA